MQTVHLTSRVGRDGVLHLEIPVDMPDAAVEVLVVVHPITTVQPEAHQAEDAPGWPPGFLDQVCGGWQGEPLERAPQGAYEVRESLG